MIAIELGAKTEEVLSFFKSFPAMLHRLLVTPPEHRLHHAKAMSLCDGNFAVVTPLWDLVFGTFRHPDAYPLPEVGIADDPMPAGFWGQAFSPFLWKRFAVRGVDLISSRS